MTAMYILSHIVVNSISMVSSDTSETSLALLVGLMTGRHFTRRGSV